MAEGKVETKSEVRCAANSSAELSGFVRSHSKLSRRCTSSLSLTSMSMFKRCSATGPGCTSNWLSVKIRKKSQSVSQSVSQNQESTIFEFGLELRRFLVLPRLLKNENLMILTEHAILGKVAQAQVRVPSQI